MAEEREEDSNSPTIAEDQIFVEETPAIIPQEQNLPEENLQEQKKGLEESREIKTEGSREKARIGKKRQRRRAITYLSHISKQVEKNGNQIGSITTFILSLQKQRQSESQSINQIKSQLVQLQKQVLLVQKDIQKLRTASARKIRFRKSNPSTSATTTVKPKSRMSRKNKAIARTRLRRRRIKKR
ncbi:MAG: hypothetical protein WBX01_13595 [Nitrososphaeraceae archaeon]|jgi:hypothetical protein